MVRNFCADCGQHVSWPLLGDGRTYDEAGSDTLAEGEATFWRGADGAHRI